MSGASGWLGGGVGRRRCSAGALLGLFLALCPWVSGGARERTAVTVFAASSTTEVLQELAAAFEKKTGTSVRLSFAASSVLARQIEAGAPAEVFVSADLEWMDYLAHKGLIRAGSRRDLAGNRLVLVTPRGHALHAVLAPGFDLPGAFTGRLAVPAGRYARQALEHFGWWAALLPRLAQAENVRAALRLVEVGEAGAGIVYATDAAASTEVVVAGTFPPSSHAPIVYPAALCGEAGPSAAAFLDFLSSKEAAGAWRAAGFEPVG
jgi:molybdate transport system substrate-binding protein